MTYSSIFIIKTHIFVSFSPCLYPLNIMLHWFDWPFRWDWLRNLFPVFAQFYSFFLIKKRLLYMTLQSLCPQFPLSSCLACQNTSLCSVAHLCKKERKLTLCFVVLFHLIFKAMPRIIHRWRHVSMKNESVIM